MRFGNVPRHLPADPDRVLKAGVLGGQVHIVGAAAAQPPDIHPPLLVFVTGAAAQHLDGCAGVVLLERPEQCRKAQKIVGVIHNDGAPVLLQHIHPPRHRDLLDPGSDGVIADAERPCRGNGRHRIFNVKATLHRDAEGPPALPVAHRKGKPGLLLADVLHPHVTVGVAAVHQHRFGVGLGSGVNLLMPVGPPTDDGNPAIFHQLQLAVKIVLEIFMLQRPYVVLRKIEEQPRRKGHPVHPLLLVRLGGNLHRQVADAVGKGIGKALLQFQALRGGQVGLLRLAAGVHLHGGKHGGAVSQRRIQYIFDEVGGGGFALGAGQPDEGQPVSRVAVVFRRQNRKRLSHIPDEQRGGGVIVGLLRHIAGRPGRQRLLQVFRLKIQPLADKQPAGGNGAAIVGNGREGQLPGAAGGIQQQVVLPQHRLGAGKGKRVFHRFSLQ